MGLSDREELGGVRETAPVLRDFLNEKEAIRVWEAHFSVTRRPSYDMHYALELGILLSGRMRRLYRHWQTEIGTGDVWFQSIWEPHGYAVVRAPCKAIVIAVLPQLLADTGFEETPNYEWLATFVVPPELRPRMTPRIQGEVLNLARRLVDRVSVKGPERERWLRVLLLELLLLLREDWKAPPVETNVSSADSYKRINPSLEMVFDDRQRVSVFTAAEVCGMSRNAFSRGFKALMGISFAEYGLRYRVSGGASQLRRTQDAVKAVAAAWGFADGSHFRRCFFRHYGCTPAEYRRKDA